MHTLFKNPTFKAIVGTYGIKIANAGLLLLTNLFLAHLLGAEDLGVYKYVMAWIALLTVPSMLGLGQLIVREVAAESSRSNWNSVKGIIHWSRKAVISASLSIAMVSAIYAYFFSGGSPLFQNTFIIALLLLPLTCLLNVYQTTVRGLDRILEGQVLEQLTRQFLFLLSLVLSIVVWTPMVTLQSVILINIMATLSVVFWARWQLNRLLPVNLKDYRASYQRNAWRQSIFSFMLNSGLNVLNSRIDIIMLGALLDMRSTGIYAIASEFGGMIVYVAIAANMTLSPKVAKLYSEGNFHQIENLIRKTSYGVIGATAVMTLGMILLGKLILSAFGTDFVNGYYPLVIICIGKSFHAILGLTGMLFNMTGNEKFTAISSGIGTGCNFVLNLILIPTMGMAGAAIATVIGGLITVGFLFLNCKRIVGIRPLAF